MSLSKAFAVMRSRYKVETRNMAKDLGCSIRNVQNQMAEGANPKFHTIVSLCSSIGCTVSELIAEYELIKTKDTTK